MNFHVKGGLFLTGNQWSSSRKLDDRWKPSGYAWRFDFNDGRPFDGDELWFNTDKHALCVRDSTAESFPQSNPAATVAAPSLTGPPNPAQDAQALAYWIDPSTGRMWAARDNGKDLNLGEALKYCRDLRASGYSGWKLATIDELEKLHVSSVKASKPANMQGNQPLIDRATGKPLLTADQWSSSPVIEDRGYPSRFVWYLNVSTGTRLFDDPSFSHAKRALCVRSSVVQHGSPAGASGDNAGSWSASQIPSQEARWLGYWIDPSTGLMWAGRDNMQNFILYSEATMYCRNLRLARYADWRLATMEELQGIYDEKAQSPGATPRSYQHEPEPLYFHVKGNLFLTGMQWGSTSKNDGGNPSGYVWVFDFHDGRLVNDKGYSIKEKRALCVRRPGK
jgi:hypothetical protein